jgi:predicted nucleic acid-binding Zn ribbon protein
VSWHLRRIGDDVGRELRRLGPNAALGDVVRVWPEAVGVAIAANAWPARLARDGTLHVATRSSAWAFELTQLESVVRARLGERLGEDVPRSLRFAVGALPEGGAETVEKRARDVPRAGPEDEAAAAEIAGPIGDDELRRLVARAAAASLARRRADRPI